MSQRSPGKKQLNITLTIAEMDILKAIAEKRYTKSATIVTALTRKFIEDNKELV
jgi:hypothetical protein